MATVKVAVRVRPMNKREVDMDSRSIIEMDGKLTRVFNPKIPMSSHQGDIARDRAKDFVYDFSYCSADPGDANYTSQEQVFLDLGTKVVESAFEGYNACVFAYGQTGSGKTYTMMGTEGDIGLIPRICQNLFSRMQHGKDEGVTFRTEVSYLEIYNEKVKDLLKKGAKQHNLRLREHPKLGPYVQDLSKHLVMDYRDVEDLMQQGNAIRTTASTKMNDTSSRSHAIFTLNFVQAKFDCDTPIETVSKIHLVDLAGSERADASGATGERLKEGGHINKSLVTLGSVISALADASTAVTKSKQVFVPYRDSTLTWLLKDSLGGNSKTIMIAAISPAECNYGETLSTLRYANRAKNIINKPQVNEDPNVKLIRDLKEEIAKLKGLLTTTQSVTSTSMVERLHENEARVKLLTEEWTERWRETQKILQEQKALGLRKAGMGVVLDSDMPHLVGIDDDLLSTGITLYHLKEGLTRIGCEPSQSNQSIVLNGIGIEPEHCVIDLHNGTATLKPIAQACCYVDGVPTDGPTKLSQGCVLLLGRTNMFRYNDPAEAAKLRKEKKGKDLTRSRLSFLSWSMPDLARVSDQSPCSKLYLTGMTVDGSSNQMNRRDVEKRLFEEKDNLDLERKRVHDSWEALYDREKRLLEAIDASDGNTEDERWFMDSEQEAIEREQQRLELEEARLDERERALHAILQKVVVDESLQSSFAEGHPPRTSTNGSWADNSRMSGTCESVLEESGEIDQSEPTDNKTTTAAMVETETTTKLDDSKTIVSGDSIESEAFYDNERSLCLRELQTDERIRELVEQEVQRHLLNEMASRLRHLRLIKERGNFGVRNGVNEGYYQRTHVDVRSLSLGYLSAPVSQACSFAITIPSYVYRGSGYATHQEYEVKVSPALCLVDDSICAVKTTNYMLNLKKCPQVTVALCITSIGDFVTIQGETWTVFRRYRRFRELHLRMKQLYGSRVGDLYFPSRTFLPAKSDKIIKERQAHLERYLQQLVDVCVSLPQCPLSEYTYDTMTKHALCECLPFLRKGLFEVGKHGTA